MPAGFEPVFDRLAQGVSSHARLACEWVIPNPPPGTAFDPARTNVEYSSAAVGAIDVARAGSLDDCAAAADGWAWHYDDQFNPNSIRLCPEACAAIGSDPAATVNV